MGTEIKLVGVSAIQAKRTFELFFDQEKRFSRFYPESELNRVNSAMGRSVAVSADFIQVMTQAIIFFKATEGLFTPFLGKQMERIGYDRSFDAMGFQEQNLNLTDVPSPEHPLRVEIDRQRIQVDSAHALDLGGFAKGWSVGIAASQLSKVIPSGMVDAGGDIFIWQNAECPLSFRLGIEDPDNPGKHLIEFSPLGSFAVTTSSVRKRQWLIDGHYFHHIIDPRTGWSAQSDCIQSTVFGDDPAECEAYAKCALILGMAEGSRWLDIHHSELSYFMVAANGQQYRSTNLPLYCSEIQNC